MDIGLEKENKLRNNYSIHHFFGINLLFFFFFFLNYSTAWLLDWKRKTHDSIDHYPLNSKATLLMIDTFL
jgi:hypothetical protein